MFDDSADIKVLFFGTPTFAATGLQSLIDHPNISVVAAVTQPDRPAGRGKKLKPSPVKSLAESHNIPVLQPERLKREQKNFMESLSEFGAIDIGVVIAFGQILPRKILEVPQAGCVNVHASLLPRWRGAAPIQRAILAGDTTTGICLMRMEEGLDTGPVYAQQELIIGADEDCGSLHDRLAECGATLLAQHLVSIVHTRQEPTVQPEEGITYAHKINRQDAFIDWSEPCEQVDRVVRAFSPVPGAYTFIDERRVKILKAKVGTQSEKGNGEPGEIIDINQDTIDIQCGSGSLSVQELQPEGKKKMPTADFVRGSTLSVGTICKSKPGNEEV